ncbi:MAG TPA: nuclear transport factor 2 family protein [Solirubrobacterales bacterium]|nr:nuclear transport factor 2 family protein [Solirubrobacterales bacterium]
MKSDAFKQAAESKDFSKLEQLFSPQVVFRSPAVFKPYSGLEALGVLLGAVAETFEDFLYLDQVETADTAVLVFEARVSDRQLNGVDILRFDGEGLIAEMMVMIRPLSGLNALAEAMGRRLGVGAG